MSSSDRIRSMIEMLFTWGMEGIDERDTQPRDILAAFGQEAWNIGDRYVRRNVIGDRVSRYVPQDIKVAVAVRDQGQCTAILEDGTRCPVRKSLHYDHRFIPFRLGGPQTIWNLALLCEEHNWHYGGKLWRHEG